MILQALNEFYDRKSDALAPDGWISKGVDYVVVLDEQGNFVGLECLQLKEGKKDRPRVMLLPNIGKQALKHNNSGKDANLLWDNSAFVFGLGNKGKEKIESFLGAIDTNLSGIDDVGVRALKMFILKGVSNPSEFSPIINHPEFGESILTKNPVIIFRLAEDSGRYIFERDVVRESISDFGKNESDNKIKGVCLVTGEENAEIELSHTVIKNVWGGQTSGGAIVSFNERAFESYGKRQLKGLNAPVSKKAAQKYVKALNYLLESDQRVQVGDASTVFWSERDSQLESDFSVLFDEPPKDDPCALTNAVKALYNAVNTGAVPVDDKKTKFFVLGLSPNAARISIRFWQIGTVAEFSEKIKSHFDDIAISHSGFARDQLSLKAMLKAIAPLNDLDRVPPNIAGDWMRSILTGASYPDSLFQMALRKSRSHRDEKVTKITYEVDVEYPCAAIIKAYLNRKSKSKNQSEKEITVSLDRENSNPGYRLGRLFAVLERMQEKASGGKINSTIRDRYYSAASSTPGSVMPILMRLKNHHLSKLESGRNYFESLIGEILLDVSDFPSQMTLQDQGRFAIGYYHQRQDFLKKSDKSDQGE